MYVDINQSIGSMILTAKTLSFKIPVNRKLRHWSVLSVVEKTKTGFDLP